MRTLLINALLALLCLFVMAARQSPQSREPRQRADLRMMYAVFDGSRNADQQRAEVERILALTPDSRAANEIKVALTPTYYTCQKRHAQLQITTLAEDVASGRADPLETIEEHERRVYAKEFATLSNSRLTMHIDRVPLIDALRQVAKQTDCDVFINYPELEWAGVDWDMPVTLHVDHVPTMQVLQRLLEVAAPTADHGVLACQMMQGVLVISTTANMPDMREMFLQPSIILE